MKNGYYKSTNFPATIIYKVEDDYICSNLVPNGRSWSVAWPVGSCSKDFLKSLKRMTKKEVFLELL